MKKLMREIFFGKNAQLSGILALSIVGFIALGCGCGKDFNLSNSGKDDNSVPSSPASRTATKPDASNGTVPTDDQLQGLVKKTVMDFNDAVQSGDFSNFHDTLSKPFQKQASAEKLEGVFHEFVEAKINFSKVKDLEATFAPAPAVENDSGFKVLHTKGVYATSPRKTNFDLKYLAEGADWRLNSIEINTKDQ